MSTLPPSVDLPPLTGCPCGCLRDADCIRHRPFPVLINWQVYTVEELGLASHDPEQRNEIREV